VKGVYYGGEWLDIEDCGGRFNDLTVCSGCDGGGGGDPPPCPRSRSRNTAHKANDPATGVPVYDVCIVGAGCIGAAIARELSKYRVHVLLVEAADDVSQGATKGNSGIVHAGYDDAPGSVRAEHCWRGNQMFAQLDRELRFGYQRNGSLVLATSQGEVKELENLLKRGEKNGVRNLRIVRQAELRAMEPHVTDDAIAALYAPDAGNVIPYEFAIALAENAVDNGVELRIRTQVTEIEAAPPIDNNNNNSKAESLFTVLLEHWEPDDYVKALAAAGKAEMMQLAALLVGLIIFAHYLAIHYRLHPRTIDVRLHMAALVLLFAFSKFYYLVFPAAEKVTKSTPLAKLVQKAGPPQGTGGQRVQVEDMVQGGSGSAHVLHGKRLSKSKIQCKYIINCAGGSSDKVARLIGDDSFTIKPRLGDYLLLNRNQVRVFVDCK
jgi:FAD dependent oxidoreductase